MSKAAISSINIVTSMFDEIKTYSDQGVVNHLALACRLNRKRIIPKSVRCNAYSVSRRENALTVHFLLNQKETARVSFVPIPSFN